MRCGVFRLAAAALQLPPACPPSSRPPPPPPPRHHPTAEVPRVRPRSGSHVAACCRQGGQLETRRPLPPPPSLPYSTSTSNFHQPLCPPLPLPLPSPPPPSSPPAALMRSCLTTSSVCLRPSTGRACRCRRASGACGPVAACVFGLGWAGPGWAGACDHVSHPLCGRVALAGPAIAGSARCSAPPGR